MAAPVWSRPCTVRVGGEKIFLYIPRCIGAAERKYFHNFLCGEEVYWTHDLHPLDTGLRFWATEMRSQWLVFEKYLDAVIAIAGCNLWASSKLLDLSQRLKVIWAKLRLDPTTNKMVARLWINGELGQEEWDMRKGDMPEDDELEYCSEDKEEEDRSRDEDEDGDGKGDADSEVGESGEEGEEGGGEPLEGEIDGQSELSSDESSEDTDSSDDVSVYAEGLVRKRKGGHLPSDGDARGEKRRRVKKETTTVRNEEAPAKLVMDPAKARKVTKAETAKWDKPSVAFSAKCAWCRQQNLKCMVMISATPGSCRRCWRDGMDCTHDPRLPSAVPVRSAPPEHRMIMESRPTVEPVAMANTVPTTSNSDGPRKHPLPAVREDVTEVNNHQRECSRSIAEMLQRVSQVEDRLARMERTLTEQNETSRQCLKALNIMNTKLPPTPGVVRGISHSLEERDPTGH